MMALANLLHHPRIGPEPIQNTSDKRSNKDLGRVLALAWLAIARDGNAMQAWSTAWLDALKNHFPHEWTTLAARAGDGIRALLASPPDLEQATRLCNDGLLARRKVTTANLTATGRRLLIEAMRPLEGAARESENK
jgi:hypothetical protein